MCVQISASVMILLTMQMPISPHPRITTITLLVTYQVLESPSAIATLGIVAVAVKWIGVTITAWMKENAHMYLMVFYAIANLGIGDPDAKILSKRKCLFRIKLKLYNCFLNWRDWM